MERVNKGVYQNACVWREARKFLALVIMAVMVSGSLLVKVEAAPAGTLDTTFGTGGKQTTSFGESEDAIDSARATVVQPDGKIVVAGSTYSIPGGFAIARYNSDGTLDTTFSGDGKQTTDFGERSGDAYAMALQSDGKIVVVGETLESTKTHFEFALIRYNRNGTLDRTFSGDGKQTTDFFGLHDYGRAVAIQPDGKIVVVGMSSPVEITSTDFAIARYNSNGTLDTTFSSDGKQTAHFGDDSRAFAVAIQPNGKIVVAGSTLYEDGLTGGDFALARYNSNGTLDKTFSGDGKQTTDFFSTSQTKRYESGFSLALQSDGKIVLAGSTFIDFWAQDFALARYNTNGSLDDGSASDSTPNDIFGTNGTVTTNFFNGDDSATDIALQPDGKIVAAGYAAPAPQKKHDFALARYNIDGTLDRSFSGDGRRLIVFRSGNYAEDGEAIAIQPDGKIVVAGVVQTPFPTPYGTRYKADFALARVIP